MFQSVQLMIRLLYSVNKNLFYERWSFLKGKSEKCNNGLYMIYYFLKNYVFFWVLLYILCRNVQLYSVPFYLLFAMLLIKLLRIDNNDWQLFFRADYKIAVPDNLKRYKMVLIGNFVNHFFVEDCIAVYFVVMSVFVKLNPITYIALFIGFIGIYIFTETFFFILRGTSQKLKKVYALVSYLVSMFSSCVSIYVILRIVISLISTIDFIKFKENPNVAFSGVLNKVFYLFADMTYWLEHNQALIVVLSLSVAILCLIPIFNIRQYFANVSMVEDICYLPFVNWITKRKSKSNTPKSLRKEAFIEKEIKLLHYIFKYNYEQFYFSILLDRSSAVLIAIFLNLLMYNNVNLYLIFFCVTLVIFTLEISSSISVKMISNMSFVTDYNTVRLANINGIEVKELVDAKMTLYYRLRLLPTILFSLMSLLGLAALKAPIVTYPLMLISILVIYKLYPKVFFVNNLINTKMDYKNYEQYLEDSKILDTGVGDFITISMIFKLKSMIVVLCIIGAYFISTVVAIYVTVGVAVLFAIIGYIDYCIMDRIGNNIISFIEGGNYSADIRKIFRKSNKDT